MLVAGFHTSLKILLLCSAYLFVLVTCITEHNNSEKNVCPLWHIESKNGDCVCGANYYNTVTCDKNYVYLLRGNCITWSSSTNSAVFHECLYSPLWNTTQVTYRIPKNIPGTKVNDITCKDYNRKDDQCSKCIDGYGPALFSYGITCTDCSKYRHLWSLNLLFQIAMVCLMYLIFALLQINLTSSPLNLIVMYVQFIVLLFKIDGNVYFEAVYSVGRLPMKILFTVLAIANLDFFHMVLPALCISTRMKTIDVLIFDYAIAIVPLLFTILVFLCIELYDRKFRLIVLLSYPVRCLTRFRSTWNPRKTILATFASFFLLSYSKFMFVSIKLLLAFYSYNSKGEPIADSAKLLLDPAIKPFHSEHIAYAVLAFSALFIFVLFPTLFLLFYPTRLLKRVISSFGFQRWDILNQFMDIFQGWYKDGTNGTRDYRYFFAFYLLLRIGLLCEFVVLFLVNYNWKHMLTLKYSCTGVAHVLLGVLLYTIQPYKISWMNQVDGLILTTAGILSLLFTFRYKGVSILALAFGLLAFTFMGIYHKIYKCTKKCNYK